MRIITAIAGKELRGYFASPIGYVLVGFFALLFGWFFYTLVAFFERQSMQMAGGPGGAMNVNQMLITPLLLNSTVVMLLVFPLITMRTYAEEKRSRTIELLLTAPITDFEIIMGKFLGALALFAAMLSVTLLHMGLLFFYGNPEWKPIATGYLGLLLMGGSFLSLGLFISSLTKNQIVAGMITFSVFLLLWVINWVSSFVSPEAQTVINYLSVTEHFDDFSRGIIDTKHIVYYLSFIATGLFLTMKSVDSERWRG